VRRKGETKFARESGLLILINSITRAQSKEAAGPSIVKSTVISLAVWNLRMADHIGKGLIARGLFMRGLVVRGLTKRNLIDQGDIVISLTMMSLCTTAMTWR
jgi:hypothetical protein